MTWLAWLILRSLTLKGGAIEKVFLAGLGV